MKKVFIPAVLALAVSSNAFAFDQNDVDTLCERGPGHWSGTFTLKDENLCKQFNGCTHYVQADISTLGGNQFLLKLQPSIGTSGQAPVECNNGKITSVYLPGGVAYVHCSGEDKCSVDYADANLISHMHKQRS